MHEEMTMAFGTNVRMLFDEGTLNQLDDEGCWRNVRAVMIRDGQELAGLVAPVQFGQGCCFSFFSSSSTSIILGSRPTTTSWNCSGNEAYSVISELTPLW
jgi:hypothetical protein